MDGVTAVLWYTKYHYPSIYLAFGTAFDTSFMLVLDTIEQFLSD